jgi:ABC-type transporter Mla subunit MlaD
LGAQNPAFQQNPFGGGVGALQQTTLQQLIPQQLHQLQYLQQYAAQQLQQLSQVVPQQLQQIQQLLQVLPQQIQQLQQQLAQQGIGSQSTGFGIPQGTSPWAWSMMAPSLGAPQGGAGFPTGQVM